MRHLRRISSSGLQRMVSFWGREPDYRSNWRRFAWSEVDLEVLFALWRKLVWQLFFDDVLEFFDDMGQIGVEFDGRGRPEA